MDDTASLITPSAAISLIVYNLLLPARRRHIESAVLVLLPSRQSCGLSSRLQLLTLVAREVTRSGGGGVVLIVV